MEISFDLIFFLFAEFGIWFCLLFLLRTGVVPATLASFRCKGRNKVKWKIMQQAVTVFDRYNFYILYAGGGCSSGVEYVIFVMVFVGIFTLNIKNRRLNSWNLKVFKDLNPFNSELIITEIWNILNWTLKSVASIEKVNIKPFLELFISLELNTLRSLMNNFQSMSV